MLNNNKTIIKIDNDFRVEVDKYNYTLIQRIPESKDNKAHDNVIGYYPSLHNALTGLKRQKITTLSELTIDEYINELCKLENWVSEKEEKLNGR